MRVGGSLALIAIGAILKFAVTAKVSGIDLRATGVVLMVVGLVGLVISLAMISTRRQAANNARLGESTYVEPGDPYDPGL